MSPHNTHSSHNMYHPTERAKRTLPSSKNLFIALAGNIGTGKTTIATILSQEFGFSLFEEPVVDNRFLSDYYGDMKRWSFTLQLEFLIKRVQHHEAIHGQNISCVQDRTLYEDPEVFAKYLHGLGNMEGRELDLYFEYFERLTRNLNRPNKVLCLWVPEVQTLLERIRIRGRTAEANIPSSFLEGLNGYYTAFPNICEKKYGLEVMRIDVSRVDIRSGEAREQMLDAVYDFMLH